MRSLLFIFTVLSLTACNGTIKNFVGGATPNPAPQPSNEPPEKSSGGALKLSPGYMKASNNGVGLEAHITPTKKVVSGGGLSAELTMSQTPSR